VQARHTGKIVISQRHQLVAEQPESQFRADATYLITGGMGGLGLATAQFLVAGGARHLVLLGRHAPNEEARKTIDLLRGAGATVVIHEGSVAEERDVVLLLESIRSKMPPLRGVVHSAGVLADGAVLKQRWEQFAEALGPKVIGTWNLHRMTL